MKVKAKPVVIIAKYIFLTLACGSVQAIQSVDKNLPDYQKTTPLSGHLVSVGSDTLANLITLWANSFKTYYPNIQFQIQSKGSATAPIALTAGIANIATMSRKMNTNELALFEKKYGYKPTLIPVAIDALAIYVNKDNPINRMTIAQVDAIMSSTRKCGYTADISTWGHVGLTGLWSSMEIDLYGRNLISGTNSYFKNNALCEGEFKSKINEQPGSASIVQSISTALNGIGYSGIGYKSSGVKAIALAKKEGMPFVEATAKNALSGAYPLARFLYFYVNKNPSKALAPLEQEFIKLALSKQGQQLVIKDGYVPLPEKIINKKLSDLGMGTK